MQIFIQTASSKCIWDFTTAINSCAFKIIAWKKNLHRKPFRIEITIKIHAIMLQMFNSNSQSHKFLPCAFKCFHRIISAPTTWTKSLNCQHAGLQLLNQYWFMDKTLAFNFFFSHSCNVCRIQAGYHKFHIAKIRLNVIHYRGRIYTGLWKYQTLGR